MKKTLLLILFMAGAGAAAKAQTVGVGLVGSGLNHAEFRAGVGAGVWGTVPLGASRWSLGAALSYTEAKRYYNQCNGLFCSGPSRRTRFTNRIYSASVIAPRQLHLGRNTVLALGPSLGYSSIGAKGATEMADRIFGGVWADLSYNLTSHVRLNLLLHPRWSPAGNGGSTDIYDPFSRRSLLLNEIWFGLSYALGSAQK